MTALFDVVIALGILLLALRVLSAADAFEAVVLFITFGLLMAIAWARLLAPDIALAEAAIGAGLTGVLLLDTLRAIRETSPPAHKRRRSFLADIPVALLAGVLVATVLQLPAEPAGLTVPVSNELRSSGTGQPVTAVLLNFRAYDTWLELAVLLIAVAGVLALRGDAPVRGDGFVRETPGVFPMFVRALVPVVVLVAGYLLWLGKSAAGGAFQAGVVLGAAGVMMRLAGWRSIPREWLWRAALAAGAGAFLLVATALLPRGSGSLLQYPAEQAGNLILFIETAAAISIGATMVALFIGLRSGVPEKPAPP